MSLFIQYNFDASSFSAPDTVRNLAPGDSSSYYDGKIINNPTINSGGVTSTSASILFKSSKQQYMSIPYFSTKNNGLTFAYWFKSNNNSTWARIFDFGNGPRNNNIIAYINNGNMGFYVGSTGSNLYQIDNVIPNINNNIWNHVVWTISYPKGWKIYLNGNLYATYNEGYYPRNISRNINYIGRSNWADPYFNGNITDFRMYNSVLNQSDISGIYNDGLATTNVKTGDAVLNAGYNELYSQIFCDLFRTNNGFNQCTNCNYGKQQIHKITTQNGEQNCLNSCKGEKLCTSYSYDTTVSTNNCKQYSSFPTQILNSVNGINSGYALGKYNYDYNKLSSKQKLSVKEKCVAQYLNNNFTPDYQIDVSKCLSYKSSEDNTNIDADPTCVYNTYYNNGIIPYTKNTSTYNNNQNYNLSFKGDPEIDNYNANYNTYSDNLVQASNINNKLSTDNNNNPNNPNPNSNTVVSNTNNSLYGNYEDGINEKDKQISDAFVEPFENEINNKNYNNYIKLTVLLIIILLIFFVIYSFKKK
jgi:hypothetical protein